MPYQSQLIKKYRAFIFLNTFMCAAVSALTLVTPFVAKYALDNLQSASNIALALALFVGALLLVFCIRLVLNHLVALFSRRFKVAESVEVYRQVCKMKYSALTEKEPTYLVERISIALHTLSGLFSDSIPNAIVTVLTLGGIMVILFILAPVVAVIYLFIIPIQFFGYKKLNEKLQDKSQHLQAVSSKNFMEILNVLSNVDWLKQLGDTTGVLSILRKRVDNVETEGANVTRFGMNMSALINFVVNALQNIIYVMAAYMAYAGNIEISDLLFISIANGIFFSSLSQLGAININLRDLKGAQAFLQDDIFASAEADGTADVTGIQTIDFEISELKHNETVLIKSGKCANKAGDIVFVAGKSGAGKSTLLRCVNKLHENNFVKINGADVNSLTNRTLRAKIFVLSQNIPILPMSVKDNILLGNTVPDSTWRALLAKPFMKKFAAERMIKENGVNLSGGDKQKIAAARLYLEDPDVIILDESFNSIDEATAREMLRDICHDFKNKIIYIVSHNDFAKEFCNATITIEDGELRAGA